MKLLSFAYRFDENEIKIIGNQYQLCVCGLLLCFGRDGDFLISPDFLS